MKSFLLFTILLMTQLGVIAQTAITGAIVTKKGEPIIGANVFVDGTFDGTSTDLDGKFTFQTTKEGEAILKVSYIGFLPLEVVMDLQNEPIILNLEMREDISEMEVVTITAGSFEASDEKKAVVLKPLDIVTTAGALGDINGALNTLPGTQTVGETGQLFVRGGDGYETKTFIDGLQVLRPYSSTPDDLPARGRFSPFLFKGTLFSTGAYSAEYGQALSSALILETQGIPEKSNAGISIMSVGLGATHIKKWENTSVTASLDYNNLAPMFQLVPQSIQFDKAPETINGSMVFRQKTSKTGMLKIMSGYSRNHTILRVPNAETYPNDLGINLLNDYGYVNASYTDILGDNWGVYIGGAFTENKDDIDLTTQKVAVNEKAFQGKIRLNNQVNNYIYVKFGLENIYETFEEDYENVETNFDITSVVKNNQTAAFIESDVILSKNLVARIGGRIENSSYLNKMNIAPRLSMAYKTGENSQVSLAYGSFYQNPQNEFLKLKDDFNFEQADHFIANFQYAKNNRIFRAEAYLKNYDQLVKFNEENLYNPKFYNNEGTGYAKGIDLFWRDQKSIKFGDYWVSYSYLDTERDYRNYPTAARPSFASTHNLSVVYKHFISKLNCQVGATYNYASGRPYENPNTIGFNNEKTPHYHDLSMNVSYLTSLLGNFTVLYASATNVLGRNHIFGYRYSDTPNPQGQFDGFAVEPPAKRFLFIGMFITVE